MMKELLCDKCHESRFEKNIRFLDFLSKFSPLLIFISGLYGAVLLFNLSLSYEIDFVDLVKPNVLITFGALSFILIIMVAILPPLMMYVQHMESRFIIRSFIYRSRMRMVRENPIPSLIILCLALSLWPFLFLFNQIISVSLAVFFVCIIVVYIRFLTVFKRGCVSVYKNNIHIIRCLCSILLPMMIGFMCLVINLLIFIKEIGHASMLIAMSVVSACYFALTLITLLMALKYSIHKGFMTLCGVIITSLFLIFSFPLSDTFLVRIAQRAGLGFELQCYLKDDFIKNEIPDEFKRNTMSDNIVKLTAIANVETVYYLSKDISPISKAQLRIKSDTLKRISCPLPSKEYISKATGR